MSVNFREASSILFERQSVRYVINGLLATSVHFAVLTFNLKYLAWNSAGLSNLFAAIFGITTSFIGSRYYVFRGSAEPLARQAFRFIFLYIAVALLHGAMLYLWVDVYLMSYVTGFVLATFMQMVFSFWGNKVMVFKV